MYPDGQTRSHAASDGSLHELFLFAEALDLDGSLTFVRHGGIPHYRIPSELFSQTLVLPRPRVREAARKELVTLALTRAQIEATRVVNLNLEACDLIVDRQRSSRWGNPYRIGVHGTRRDVIEQHRRNLLEDPDALDALKLLKSKTLGCHCKPQACHADTYVALIRGTHTP